MSLASITAQNTKGHYAEGLEHGLQSCPHWTVEPVGARRLVPARKGLRNCFEHLLPGPRRHYSMVQPSARLTNLAAQDAPASISSTLMSRAGVPGSLCTTSACEASQLP